MPPLTSSRTQRDALYAASLDAPECAKLRAEGDADHGDLHSPLSIAPVDLTRVTSAAGLLLVCTDRVLRLAAKTASQRDDWVEALNMNLVRSHIILKGSEMGLVRMTDVLKRMSKKKAMKKLIKPLVRMYTVLEAECQREYVIAKALQRIESAEATGREVDLEAAQMTQEAFWQAQEAMSAVKAHVDVEALMGLMDNLGLSPYGFEQPVTQRAFQQEYHKTKNMFKGLQAKEEEEDDDWMLFPMVQVYEGALGLASQEKARKQKRMWVTLYEDKLCWWKSKKAKARGKKPTGFFEMRDLMQAENTAHQNFRITHFDDKRSLYFFTPNAVDTERWLDQISHTMIRYNSKEHEARNYKTKYATTEETLAGIMRAVRSKADSPPMWSMYTLYLHGYDVELFERCAGCAVAAVSQLRLINVPRRLAEVRSLGNSQRETVTSNNPHMMKRRVAAQLDEVAASAQHLPLAVTLAHGP